MSKPNKKVYMAVNQYGTTVHGLIKPRKELCERAGVKHAELMYVEGNNGKLYHVGYVVAGEWWRLYEVTPFRKEVK